MNLRHKLRPECVKFLQKNIGEKLLDIGLSNNFLNITSEAKLKLNKWD